MIIHATFLEEAKAALSQRSRQPRDVKIIVAGYKRKARDDDGDYHAEVKGAAMDLLLDKEYDAATTNVMVRQIGAYGRSVRVGDSVAHPFHRESMAIGISGQSLVEATAAGSRLRPLSYDPGKEIPLTKAVVPGAAEAPVRASSLEVEARAFDSRHPLIGLRQLKSEMQRRCV